MLVNKAIISLVATIFFMISICGSASAKELSVTNNSDSTFLQNQSIDDQFLTVRNNSDTNAMQMSAVNNYSSPSIPAIYGDRIVWQSFRNADRSKDIYVYNINNSTNNRITASGSADYPAIYGDKIVWKDSRSKDSDIYMYNLSTQSETQITTSGSADSPAIYEDKIVWKDNRKGWNHSDIYIYNLSTSVETQITASGSADYPTIYGDKIVWVDNRNGWNQSDVYMYNLPTFVETQITTSGSSHSPAIYGDKVVWEDSRNGWNHSEIYMYNISISKEILVNTSELSPNVLGKNGTGDIYVYTSLKWNPDSVSSTNATFSIFGPGEIYMGNGSYWARLNVPKGTYTISYEPVSGYDTPTSETKILKEGDSIKFSGDYLPKKRVGGRLDFGDGYILIIKQIDSEMKEVSLELKLDERKVAEARVREHETVSLNKRSYSVSKSHKSHPKGMTIKKISIDEDGNYIDISFSSPMGGWGSSPMGRWGGLLNPSTYLIVHSIPKGASIYLDNKYVGKTSRSLPIEDLRIYSIRLELNGYKSWEGQRKFDRFDQQEIQPVLSR